VCAVVGVDVVAVLGGGRFVVVDVVLGAGAVPTSTVFCNIG
jgi:hypothetical protein